MGKKISLTSVATAQAGSAKGSACHSEKDEENQSNDQVERADQEEPGRRPEEIESRLRLRVGIAHQLLLNLLHEIEKEGSNFAAFVEDGNAESPQNCGHAKAEETADRSQAGAGAGMDCNLRIPPARSEERRVGKEC